MKIAICITLLFISIKVSSQEIEPKTMSLSNFVNESRSKVKIESRLTKEVQFKTKAVTSIEAKLKIEPSLFSSKIVAIPKATEISIIEYIGNAEWKVSYKNIIGYINELYIKQTNELDEIKESFYKNMNQHSQQELTFNKLRKDELINQFGSFYTNCILNKRIAFGMTKEMIIEAKGKPDEIKTAEGDWCIVELWIYNKENLYVYIENNTLTSFKKESNIHKL